MTLRNDVGNFEPLMAQHDTLSESKFLAINIELQSTVACFSILLLATAIPERDHTAFRREEKVVVLELKTNGLRAFRSLTGQIVVGMLRDETAARGNPTLTVHVGTFDARLLWVSHVYSGA